jgi:hypothetical protein
MTEEQQNEININSRERHATMTEEQRSEVNRKRREAYLLHLINMEAFRPICSFERAAAHPMLDRVQCIYTSLRLDPSLLRSTPRSDAVREPHGSPVPVPVNCPYPIIHLQTQRIIPNGYR